MRRTLRPATGDDEAFLRAMQYLALFVAPGAEPYPKEIVDDPAIARYFVGFGEQPALIRRRRRLLTRFGSP